MKIELFEMERFQSNWEKIVDYDLAESGILPVTVRELTELGFELDSVLDLPLGYNQTNGTPQLRQSIAQSYPAATEEQILVTNGTSEANFLVALSQLRAGDEFAFEMPNYMQLRGLARSLGAKVNEFRLRRQERVGSSLWQLDWDEFERAVNPSTRLVYLTNPNNPTGSVLPPEARERIVARCEAMDAQLICDEVYLGAEIDRDRTESFWGTSDKVIVTSGLSKAYGLPGLRIGWIVGPQELVHDCWTQHDYTTIASTRMSDIMACVAVEPANRDQLFDRTRRMLQKNWRFMQDWIDSFDGLLSCDPPAAGAMCLVKYQSDLPSQQLAERVLKNQSTLVVPGHYLGLEGCLRVWFGARPEYLSAGLGRLGIELERLR